MDTSRIKEITLELTNKCDLRCIMCNIWRGKRKMDLNPESVSAIMDSLRGPLNIALTGGEPFLYRDFDSLYKYLFKLYLKRKVSHIDISTNAYSGRIKEFLSENQEYLEPLSFSVSLDGVARHNLQRGRTDAFRKTLENIMFVKKMGIPLSIKFTITPINYKEILKVYAFSLKLRSEFYLKFSELSNVNYYHRIKFPRNKFLRFNFRQLSEIKDTLTKIYNSEKKSKKTTHHSQLFNLSCLLRFLETKNLNFITKCLTPQKSLFVTHNSFIHTCIYYLPVGKIARGRIVYDDAQFKRILKEAKTGECPKCLAYHGFLRGFNTIDINYARER